MSEQQKVRIVLLSCAVLLFALRYYEALLLIVIAYHSLLQLPARADRIDVGGLWFLKLERVRLLIFVLGAVPIALLLVIISGVHWIYLATEYLRALMILFASYALYLDLRPLNKSPEASPQASASEPEI